MISADDIKESIKNLDITGPAEMHQRILDDLLKVMETSKKKQSSVCQPNTWRIIMKSRITKLAAAAVIIVAVLVGIRQFSGPIDVVSVAWGDVVRAFDEAESVHWTKTVTLLDGTVHEKEEIWLKNSIFSRREARRGGHRFDTVVDDGKDMLVLDEEDRTAQLSDSPAAYSKRCVDFLEVFRSEDARELDGSIKEIRMLPDESTDSISVLEVVRCGFEAGPWRGKAWIDAKSGLPLRIVGEMSRRPAGEAQTYVLRTEIVFDYEPISNEVFSTDIPEGYDVLPRSVHPEIMFGRVIDQYGRAVVGAQVYTSFRDECKTDANGTFAVRKPPCTSAKSIVWSEFPIFVRAFKGDEPYRVAWTIIRYPDTAIKHLEKRISHGHTLTKEEWEEMRRKALEYPRIEGPHRTDVRGALELVINDEKDFAECIPGDPGELFGGAGDKDHNKARDIILVMAPGSVIRGQVRDSFGYPVANATITLEEMEMRIGENELFLRGLGSKNKISWKAFAITDYDGYYELNNLPASWDRATLRVEADGHKPAELNIKGPGGGGIPEEPQIVENCHIQLPPN